LDFIPGHGSKLDNPLSLEWNYQRTIQNKHRLLYNFRPFSRVKFHTIVIRLAYPSFPHPAGQSKGILFGCHGVKMKIKIQTLGDRNILEVVYSSDDLTKDDLSAQRDLVSESLKKHRLNLVLVDTTALPSLPEVVTILEHNRAVSSRDELQKAKFAVLVQKIGQREKFLEDTGVNRGVHIKCFTARENALSWL
jgi:hypothetical protein